MGRGRCGRRPTRDWRSSPRGSALADSLDPPYALFHNRERIASEQVLSGLIVFKSEPIPITVTNPKDARWQLPAGFGFLMAMAGAGGLLAATMRSRGQSITRRDIVWCSLIVLVALAAYVECQYQTTRIVELMPDAQAEWSIALTP